MFNYVLYNIQSNIARSECKISLSFYFLYDALTGWDIVSVLPFLFFFFHVSSRKHHFSCSLLKKNDLHFQRFGFRTVWQWIENSITYDIFIHSSLSELFKVFSLEPAANSGEARQPTKSWFSVFRLPCATKCSWLHLYYYDAIW